MSLITYKDIDHRSKSIDKESKGNIFESCRLYYTRYNESKTEDDAKKFVKECTKDARMATAYFSDLIECAREFKDCREIQESFKEILCMVECDDIADDEDTPDDWKDTIEKNHECDRQIHNHQIISNKFDIDKFTSNHYNQINTDMLSNLCCDTVSTFKGIGTVEKLMLALEEFMYVSKKRNISFHEGDVLDSMVSYFALSENDEWKKNKLNIVEALTESSVVDYDPKYKPDKIMETYVENPTEEAFDEALTEYINNRKFYEAASFIKTFAISYKPIFNYSGKVPFEVCDKLNTIDKLYKKVVDESFCEKKKSRDIVEKAIKEVSDVLEDINHRGEAFNTSTEIIEEVKLDDCLENRYKLVAEALENVIEELEDLDNLYYSEANIKIMEGIGSGIAKVATGAFIGGTIGKLIGKIKNVKDWFAKKLSTNDQLLGRRKGIKKVKSKIFTEETALTEFITPDGAIDVVVETFELLEGEVDKEVNDIFSEFCTQINGQFFIEEDYKCYYTTTNNIVEVHIASTQRYDITDEEYNVYIEHDISDNDAEYVYEMIKYSALPEDMIPTTEQCADFFIVNRDYAMNEFGTFLELCSWATLDKEYVKEVYDMASDYYTDGYFTTAWCHDMSNYQPTQTAMMEDHIEAIEMLSALIDERHLDTAVRARMKKTREENKKKVNSSATSSASTTPDSTSNNTSNNDKDQKANESVGYLLMGEAMDAATKAKMKRNKEMNKQDKERKNGFESITKDKKQKEDKEPMDFNNVKLFLMGLKDKAKKLNAKEQELCRNLDASGERMVEGMKKALVSDRREAIIKGSVIPSLSKSIKVGAALAGVAAINPLAGIISAIGAFAASKKLTKRERALLLDDIEIELEILNKEISNADSENNTKKMRYLMQQRRNLQRQYARIKYNMRVGKDIIPGGKSMGGE